MNADGLARLARHRGLVTAALVLVMWAAGEGTATAADTPDGAGGVLGPLNVTSSEGVPLDHYDLDPMEQQQAAQDAPEDQDPASTGGYLGVGDIIRNFLASGLFALSRTVTGFSCWLIDRVYHFPIIEKLTGPAQHVADAYERDIIGPLGIAGITLAWAFVFGLVMIMRGRVARGAGELLLSLLISAVTATTLVQPAILLGYEGPVQQTQRVALEAAVITTTAGSAGPRVVTGPCAMMTGEFQEFCLRQERERATAADDKARAEKCELVMGQARDICLKGEKPVNAAEVSVPITQTLTDTLVVQPYMLIQYGRVLKKDDPLYKAHTTLIGSASKPDPETGPCSKLGEIARKYCEDAYGSVNEGLASLEDAGPEGKAAADRMMTPDWDKVLSALLVLIAAVIIALVIVAMALALIAAQFGCVIAAVGAVAVFPLAILPGPGRGVLWRWLGYFAGCMLVLVATAVFIPLFGIAAKAVFADSNSSLLERLLILDGLVVTALVMYKRIVRGSRAAGARFARRMNYAKIGGSHLMGGQAAETAAAFSALGIGGTGGSSAHATLLGRTSAMAEATGAARTSLVPFRLGLKAAHTVLIGPRRPAATPPAVGPDGQPLPPVQPTSPSGRGPTGQRPTVPRAPHSRPARGRPTPTHPAHPNPGPGQPAAPAGVVPAGARLEAALRTTRGGRALVTASRIAYHSTLGLPAGWHRTTRAGNTRAQALRTELGRQYEHYRGVRQRWAADSRAGLGHTPTQPPTAPGPPGRTYPPTHTSTPSTPTTPSPTPPPSANPFPPTAPPGPPAPPAPPGGTS
ncbi:hypothetical protein ACVW0K_007206 [Streptomyces filamentosus]